MDSIEEFNVAEGKARIRYKDGSTYVGPVSKKRLRHGDDGELQIDDSVYCGRWKQGDFVFGSLKIDDVTLVGAFHEGCLNGQGVETADQYRFEGSFVDNVKAGAGRMDFSCGLSICGEWRGGKLVGEALVVFPHGKLKMQCWFVDGAFERAKVGRRKFEKQGEFPGAKVVFC